MRYIMSSISQSAEVILTHCIEIHNSCFIFLYINGYGKCDGCPMIGDENSGKKQKHMPMTCTAQQSDGQQWE